VTAETTVTVTEDDAPLVDTTRTIVGNTITEREIEEIPTDSRSPLDLVLTLGGTSEEQLSTRELSGDRGERGVSAPGTTPEEAGIFGLSGGAAYSNNITIDGLDNNDDRSASFRFEPSVDSIAEVQVIKNQFSAEYGRASGGRVNLRTKAGSNKFRGRVFYYFRDSALNANTWNNNRRGLEKPPFRNHDPGFTFGGPIIKNRLSFFVSYELDKIMEDTIIDAWVPYGFTSPHFNLPEPTNPERAITVCRSGSPSGNPPSCSNNAGVQVAPYIAFANTPYKKHSLTARADWKINSSNDLTFSYQMGRQNDLRAFSGTNRIADSLIGRIRNTEAYNLTHNWVINSKIVNQARAQYSTLRPRSEQAQGALAPAVLVTFNHPEGSEFGGTQVFASTSNSSDRKENRWQFQDTLTLVKGNHTMRVGGDIQNVDALYIDRFDATGTYRFSSFYWFSLPAEGAPNPGNPSQTDFPVSSVSQNFNQTSEVINRYYGLFFQDDWRVKPNLTLSFGLRWEKEKVIDDNNNWGPRFAVAWNPFKNSSKTVIRFGAGMFYNRVLLRTIDDYAGDSNELTFNSSSASTLRCPVASCPSGFFDFNVIRETMSGLFPNALTLDTPIRISNNPTNNTFTVGELSKSATIFRSLSPDLKIPESYQFNAGFEREIRKGLVFETNVTFNRTAHLWREYNPNAPILPAGLSDLNSDGQVTFTDYLLGLRNSSGQPLFEDGPSTDTVGMRIIGGSGPCTTSTPLSGCVVNVNTTNSSTSTNCQPTTNTVGITNTPVCRAFGFVNQLRPIFQDNTQLEMVAPIGNSRYIGAVFELRNRFKRFENGFGASFNLAYTLSRMMDDGIVNTSEATLPGDFAREWSRSLADRTHRISLTSTIDTPRWLGKIRFSPKFLYGSSAPFNLSAGGIDRNLDDISNDRPNFSGDPSDIIWRVYGGDRFPETLAAQFSLAPIGSPGNLPRNAGNGPSLYQFDLRMSREFRFGRDNRFKLLPSAEFTNPFNMRIFSFGSNFIDFDYLNSTNATTVAAAKAAFLAPTRTRYHRRMRFGVRFDF